MIGIRPSVLAVHFSALCPTSPARPRGGVVCDGFLHGRVRGSGVGLGSPAYAGCVATPGEVAGGTISKHLEQIIPGAMVN